MGFFFLSVPGSAPVWLHRVNLLSDRRAVWIDPAIFVKRGRNLGEKIVSQMKKRKKTLKDLIHPETNYFSVIFGEKLFSPISAGKKKKMFLSQGQQHLESGGRDEEAWTWKKENIYSEYFTECSWASFFFSFFLKSRLEFVSVFITQIIHTSVKVTRWNIQPASNAAEKYSLSKVQKPVA